MHLIKWKKSTLIWFASYLGIPETCQPAYIIMVVTDVLAPTRHQVISNHYANSSVATDYGIKVPMNHLMPYTQSDMMLIITKSISHVTKHPIFSCQGQLYRVHVAYCGFLCKYGLACCLSTKVLFVLNLTSHDNTIDLKLYYYSWNCNIWHLLLTCFNFNANMDK